MEAQAAAPTPPVVSREASMASGVRLGSGCVVGARAVVDSASVGSDNLFEDFAVVRSEVVGELNSFGSRCVVEALSVGDFNAFGARCRVPRRCVVGSGCRICPGVAIDDAVLSSLPGGCALPDGCVVLPDGSVRLPLDRKAAVEHSKRRRVAAMQPLRMAQRRAERPMQK